MASDDGVTEGGAGADLARSRGSLKRRLGSEPGGDEKRARVPNNETVHLRDLADRGLIFLGLDYEIDENGQLKLLDSSSGAQRDAFFITYDPAANPQRDLAKLSAFIGMLCNPVPRQLAGIVDRVPGAQASPREITTWLRDLIRANSKFHADAIIAGIELRKHLNQDAADYSTLVEAIPGIFDFIERTYGHTIYTILMDGARRKFGIPKLPFFRPEENKTIVNLMLQDQFKEDMLSSPDDLQQWMWEQMVLVTLYALQVDFSVSLVTRAIILSEGRESANDAMRGTQLGGTEPFRRNTELFFELCRKAEPVLKGTASPYSDPTFTYKMGYFKGHATSTNDPMLKRFPTERDLACMEISYGVADDSWHLFLPELNNRA